MPVAHLTDLFIQRLQPADPHVTYYDRMLPSFGIRVGKRSRTFVIMKGQNRKRIPLGRYPEISLKHARDRAKVLLCSSQAPQSASAAPSVYFAVHQFLQAHAAKTRLGTQRQTTRILTRRFLSAFADTPLDRITTNDLTSIIDPVARTSPSEANAIHAKLNLFFNWCVRRQLIGRNPLAIVPRPAPIPQRERVLTDDELAAILRAALKIIHTPYGAIIMILAHTGLRKTEVATLSWPHITRDTITIPKEHSKNHVELVLPNTINGYLASIPKTSPALFPLSNDWHRAKKKFDALCGVSGWVLHDLRRTLSTKMAEWEIAPPDVVEAILNHKSGSRSQIQRVYDRHSRLPQMRRALSAYADRLHAMMKAH
jgi:integrase